MATVTPTKPTTTPLRSAQPQAGRWQGWQTSRLVAIGLIMVGVLLIYVRSMNYGLYLDDNHHVRPWNWGEVLGTFAGPFDPLGLEPPYYRPLTVVTFALDWQIWGFNSWGYRLSNLIFYALAAILVYELGRALFKNAPLALGAALYFVLVPSNAPTAVYISERCDALATIFILLGFLSLDRYRHSERVRWLVTMNATVIAALMSKEIGAALPLLLVLHSLLLGWRSSDELAQSSDKQSWLNRVVGKVRATVKVLLAEWRTLLIIHGSSFAVLAVMLLYREMVLPKGEVVYDHSRNPLIGYISAVYQTFRAAPWEVSPLSSPVPLVLLAAALLLNRNSTSWRAFGFGMGWLLLACLPLAPLGRIEPRLLYLPSIGYAFGVAALVVILVEWASRARFGQNGVWRMGLVVALSLVLLGATVWTNFESQDDYAPYSEHTLYHDEILYKDVVTRNKYPIHNIKIIEEKLKHAGRL